MLELKSIEFKLKFNDVVYTMKKPVVRQVKALQKKLAMKDADSFEIMLDLYEELGLPKSISNEMETEHLNQIEKYVLSQKKS